MNLYCIILVAMQLEACVHPFFDELRDPNCRLPNGRPLPPLFNFKPQGTLLSVSFPGVWYSLGLKYLVFASLVLFMHADSMTFDGMDRIERCNSGYSATLNTWACKEAESDSFTVRICSRPTIDSNLSPFLPSHYIPIMDHLSKGTFLLFLLTHSIWFLSCLLYISKGTC